MKIPSDKTIKLILLIIICILLWCFSPLLQLGEWAPFSNWLMRVALIAVAGGVGCIRIYSWAVVKDFLRISSMRAWLIKKLTEKSDEESKDRKNMKEVKKAVKKRANRVFASLKLLLTEDRKRNKYLRTTPWYVVLGQVGSGKTTVVGNSGLNFSPREQLGLDALQENTGLLDNCEWWFTRDAVLIGVSHQKPEDETEQAETYESNLPDDENIRGRAVWMGLLKLLKRYRRRKPISGVIITVSLPELLAQDTVQKQAFSHLVKQHIQDLHQQFGIKVPVYIVFTKCDLIGGFIDFFNDLNKDDRDQLWGITLPLDHPADVNNITGFLVSEYDKLISRLNERLLWRLFSEHDPKRRELMSYFPQQLQLCKNILVNFVTQTFANGDNPEDERIHFRGMYFASAQQYGRPIDFIMGAMAEKLNLEQTVLPEQLINNQSYFLKGLFKEVIFPESELVGDAHRMNLRNRRLTYVAAPVVLVLGITGMWMSYSNNKIAIGQAEDQLQYYQQEVAKLSSKDMKLVDTLSILNALQKVSAVYRHVAHPWLLYFGLYTPVLIDHAKDSAVQQVLRAEFMPRVKNYLETLLQKDASDPHKLYDELKAYLAFSYTKRIDPHWINPPVNASLSEELKGNSEQLDSLKNFLELATQNKFKPTQVNYALISSSRDKLKEIIPAKRAYWLLKQKSFMNKQKGINFEDALGGTFAQVFANVDNLPEMRFLYTYQGFKKFYSDESEDTVQQIAKSDWVVGLNNNSLSRQAKKQMAEELRELYAEEYFDRWQTLLNNLQIIKFQNIDQALRVLEILTSRQSPIPKLLDIVDSNTSPVVHAHMNIARQFKVLDRTIQQKGNEHTKLGDVRKTLNNLHEFLENINNAPDRHLAAYKVARGFMNDSLKKNPVEQLHAEAERLPIPLSRWYNNIAGHCLAAIFQEALTVINSHWQANVMKAYHENIQGRYPINTKAKAEIGIDSFASFFGPKGALDQFFQQDLKMYIDTTKTPWKWQAPLGQTIGVPDSMLVQFEKAINIRDKYFPNGSQQPKLKFSIKPKALDSQSSRVGLKLGAQSLVYQHGPQQTHSWQWPLTSGEEGTSIVFTDFSGGTPSRSYNGSWSWFKLLIHSHIHQTNTPDVYRFTTHVGSHRAGFQITTTAGLQALNLDWLKTFKLPDRL